jgi:Fe2+ or Zn2+ uptake regulation protein
MIEDLDIPPVEGLDDQVEQLGFKVTSHRLEFYGSCPKCAEESMGKAN